MSELITFNCVVDNIDRAEIVNILPRWKTCILNLKVNNTDQNTMPKLELRFLVEARNMEDVKKWQNEYEEINKSTYSIHCTAKSAGKYVDFKQRLHCQHSTRCQNVYDPSIKMRTKNTKCPSQMTIVIHSVKKRYQGKDKEKHALLTQMPCEIMLIASHNHSIDSADALRFRKVSDDVKSKLLDLFHKGHSAGTALETIKMEIQMKYDNFEEILADRKYCPDYNYCYHIYMNEFKKKYGPLEFDSAAKKFLQTRLQKYNEEMKEDSATLIYHESDYIICICPPLFKRVHKYISAASELVFMDSTGTVDHDGSRVFVLLTHSECGGLPLGIIITSSECSNIISMGLQLLKNIVGKHIFGGSTEGPSIFLTDDSTAEQSAISSTWPKSKCFLCVFHVLQSVWRWLLKAKNGISQEKQVIFFKYFQSIMYAPTVEDCLKRYEEAKNSAVQCTNFCNYLDSYWTRREQWALAYRNNLMMRGNHTNNYSEAAMRLIKDKIFERVKAFNVVQMVDFLITKFVSYYERRLLDAAHNRQRRNIWGKVIKLPPSGLIERIKVLNNNILLVPSEKDMNLFYIVNMDVLICGCFQGNTGSICKHIEWANMVVTSEEYTSKIDNVTIREKFYIIATGNKPTSSWLQPLYSKSNSSLVGLQKEALIECATNVEADVQETTEQHSDDNIINAESDINRGKEMLHNINEICKEFLQRSPAEVADGLTKMYEIMKKVKTPSSFASYCATFGTGNGSKKRGTYIGVQPTAISRRKTNLSGRKSYVGGRPRKTMNNPIGRKKSSAGHNLSKKIELRLVKTETENSIVIQSSP